jgi:hypothetical protein
MIAAPFSLLLLYLVLCGSILKALYRLLLNRDLEISSDDMGVENQYTNGPEEEWVFINGISIGDHWLKGSYFPSTMLTRLTNLKQMCT